MNSVEAGKEARSETLAAFAKAGFSADSIAKELALIGFSDIANHLTISDDGSMQMLSVDEMGKHSKAVKKVKEKTVITESKDGKELYKTSQVEYELHDKLGALEKAICIMGMKAPDKIEMNHQGNIMAAVVNHLSGNNKPPEAPKVKEKSKKAKK
jgi:predicted RNA-binding protein with RPS1 domain